MISEELKRRARDAVVNLSNAMQEAYKLSSRPPLQIDSATFPNAEAIEKFIKDSSEFAKQLRTMKTVGEK